ncbi:MAG TPA: hypothetical protein VKA70_09380 [Blastocatellia bacterium]|nr:hypothetical protein [Blastocatellia bacterium]
MEATGEEAEPYIARRLNYFNYFTEVEEEFVRRRGKPLLISPMDWALVESWKNAGIPLHLVLRAINQAFDSYDSRPRKYRKVNSMFYCQQEVESLYAEYRLAQVGAAEAQPLVEPAGPRKKVKQQAAPFPKDLLLEFLDRSDRELVEAESIAMSEDRPLVIVAVGRARARLKEIREYVESAAVADAEAIEKDLDAIDRMMLESLVKTSGEILIAEMRAEAASQLKAYRTKMDRSIYEQTLQNFVSRRLRETNRVPRLSLFYI